MRKPVLRAFMIALTVAICVSGCSKSGGQKDEFARQVLTALYAGSVESIQDKCYSPGAVNKAILELGPQTKQRYGEVKSLEYAGELEEQYGIMQRAWIVTCERGSFRLQLMTTKEDQLMGIWVDPATK